MHLTDPPVPAPMPARVPLYRQLYFQVVVAIVLGALLGHFEPVFAESMKPLGDAFIKLVKMIIAPVIFLTIVTGIASMTRPAFGGPGVRQGDGLLHVLLHPGAGHRPGGRATWCSRAPA